MAKPKLRSNRFLAAAVFVGAVALNYGIDAWFANPTPLKASVFFLGVASAGLIHTFYNIVRGRRSQKWPILYGVILSTAAEKSNGLWSPRIRYRYEVSGTIYERDRIGFGNLSWSTKKQAEHFLARFKIGKRVKVRVSPNCPDLSVIKPGIDGGRWLEVALYFAVLVLGLVVSHSAYYGLIQ